MSKLNNNVHMHITLTELMCVHRLEENETDVSAVVLFSNQFIFIEMNTLQNTRDEPLP